MSAYGPGPGYPPVFLFDKTRTHTGGDARATTRRSREDRKTSARSKTQRMKILHLSTSDSSGGAARAAYRLHTGLRRLGHDSQMLVAEKKSQDPHVTALRHPMDVMTRVRRSRRRNKIARDHARYPNRPAGYEMFSDDRTAHFDQITRQLPACDLINLHWVAGFLDYEGFFSRIPRDVPLVWRLADMNPFTGGCHYDDCSDKFTAQCGACPQLNSNDPNDLSHEIWTRKNDSLNRIPPDGLHVVGPSRWIAGEAKRSSLLGRFPISVIPNGLDVNDFAPRDRRFSRELLGVPADATVVLFAADSMENVRKGFRFLADALQGIEAIEKLFLLSVGGGNPTFDQSIAQLHLGHVSNDRWLSLAYSAADVYVIASLQESFGQTVIESMACGTPVVGFASGGIPDMVRPGVTGQLAPTRDVASLRDAILSVLSDLNKRKEMSLNCRRIAVDEYSLETQARQYVALYESLISAKTPRQ